MSGTSPEPGWTFYKFGILVTGRGEEEFLPSFLRSLTRAGNCNFQVIGRIPQRSPLTSGRKTLRMTGSGKAIPDRDASEIGLPARNYLNNHPDSFIVLVDDLEYDRRKVHAETFARYRAAFDRVLPENARHRASIHFFVTMIEAYYFAHADAINAVLGTEWRDFEGDVEDIRHPKGKLKEAKPGFHEIADGRKIVDQLDLEKVLSNPGTCASLRTLFKWCCQAKRESLSDRFQLRQGICSPVTEQQVEGLCRTIEAKRARPVAESDRSSPGDG
jgi:Domain of unknown function (DUF4276)